jgi:hypothetical protein
MVAQLYEGVDLSGRVEAPDEGPDFGESTPFWKTWWFWTAVGVLVVGGAIVIGVAAASGGEQLMPGWYQGSASIR